MGRVDKQRGASEEINADAPNVSMLIPKIIQIWNRRQKVAAEKHKSLCGGRNTDNLIKSTCLHQKVNQVYVFCSNFRQVRMFCNYYN